MGKLILSLDGGGIRGAATTQFLSRVDEVLRRNHETTLRDCVDFFAGTSTGGIIALGLARTALSMQRIDALYSVENARRIFAGNRGFFELDGVSAPKYRAEGKTLVLKEALGEDTTMGRGENGRHVLVVAYAIEKRMPMVFKSTDPGHEHLLAWQLADASSAAPTFFPTAEVTMSDAPDGRRWLIDGGVVVNNPAMCAVVEASRAWPGTGVDEIGVLSVGTGSMTRKINGPASREWGSVGWFTQGHIFDILTDERIVSYQVRNLLAPGRYIRVNAEMREQSGLPAPPDDAMDDVDEGNIAKLRALGEFWFERYGKQAVELLLGTYEGPSLERIDPATGRPIEVSPPAPSAGAPEHGAGSGSNR